MKNYEFIHDYSVMHVLINYMQIVLNMNVYFLVSMYYIISLHDHQINYTK